MYGPGTTTVINLGDVTEITYRETRINDGRARYGPLVWHVGAPYRPGVINAAFPADPPLASLPLLTQKVDFMADVHAGWAVRFGPTWTDEYEHPAPPPAAGFTTTATVDHPEVFSLTDNGDGSFTALSLGPLGPAVVHLVVASPAFPVPLEGDGLLTAVVGPAERVAVTFGVPFDPTP